MPELARFFGISIRMHLHDHPPPHVHVRYSGHSATFELAPLRFAAGRLPGRVVRLVLEWARLNHRELLAAWVRARAGLPSRRLPPLE